MVEFFNELTDEEYKDYLTDARQHRRKAVGDLFAAMANKAATKDTKTDHQTEAGASCQPCSAE